jgi:hypothetical protein
MNNQTGVFNLKLNVQQSQFLKVAKEKFGSRIDNSNIDSLKKSHGFGNQNWLIEMGFKTKDGRKVVYDLPETDEFGNVIQQNSPLSEPIPVKEVPADLPPQEVVGTQGLEMLKEKEKNQWDVMNFVPCVNPDYISWGHHRDVQKIVKSKMFYPMFITGLSGNGKTFMVEQVCAKLKRECVRVNVTIETDEDDLLGGFRLQDGETVFHKGPVVEAMERGAVLLLDEVDLASSKILCLQPVLEGKGVFLKKINQWITPAEGFNVVATANTKGKGSESGQFIGTNILNEAFLERFAITLEQSYTTPSTEKKIVIGAMGDSPDEDFAQKLVNWSDIIRKTYEDGGVDEIISTRRLVHIAKSYAIFENRMKSIELCVARFDNEIKETFMDLYTKIDEETEIPTENGDENSETVYPF